MLRLYIGWVNPTTQEKVPQHRARAEAVHVEVAQDKQLAARGQGFDEGVENMMGLRQIGVVKWVAGWNILQRVHAYSIKAATSAGHTRPGGDMERSCPRCKSSDAGEGAYCSHCKFPIGMPRKQEPSLEAKRLSNADGHEQERHTCIRCGAPVSHELTCGSCRREMQFDKLRNRRRW